MPLSLQTFTQLVNNQVSAVLAQSTSLVDFSDGSIAKALLEANAGQALWLQGLIVGLLASTRLTTSNGVQVDTFVGDFGLTRKAATPSVGQVTFSRATPSVLGIIKVGQLVLAPSGNIIFKVEEDDTNPYFNPLTFQYTIPISISSTTVPVQSTTNGLITNQLANGINTLQSIFIGIDFVTNADPTIGGEDQESDAALKIRFIQYLNGLSKATKQAIAATILSVPGVFRYNLVENVDTDYVTTRLGFFTAIIDDGTGVPTIDLIGSVHTAVDLVRGLTIAFQVVAPTIVYIDITAHIFTQSPPIIPNDIIENEVKAALNNYFNSLPVAPPVVSYTKLIEIMYDSDPTITNITGYTLNGGTSDLTPATPAIVYIVQTLIIDINS